MPGGGFLKLLKLSCLNLEDFVGDHILALELLTKDYYAYSQTYDMFETKYFPSLSIPIVL